MNKIEIIHAPGFNTIYCVYEGERMAMKTTSRSDAWKLFEKLERKAEQCQPDR